VLALVLLAPACADEPAGPPHVVVWMVDTLRADHLSCYGYERETSPRLDALAARGVLFEEMHAHSNWTQPSVASILSGTYPMSQAGDFTTALPDEVLLAAEWYARHGYRTAGFTTTVAVARRFGFGQGFEVYEELDLLEPMRARKRRAGSAYDAERVVTAALGWLDRRAPGDESPVFLYLHTVDPHEPYEPHPGGASFGEPYDGPVDGSIETQVRIKRGELVPSARDVQHLIDLYDGEIAYSDAQLGRLVDGLAERDLLDDVLLVVVSDHGQEFFEHGATGHGHESLFGELTHVPLVLHWPDGLRGGVRVPGLARGVDVLPTLLELCGLPPLPHADGVSLLARIREQQPADAPVLVRRAKGRGERLAVRTPRWLLVEQGEARAPTLFRAEGPTAESGAAGPPDGRLVDLLEAWRSLIEVREAALGERADVPLDDETRRELEALGYVR